MKIHLDVKNEWRIMQVFCLFNFDLSFTDKEIDWGLMVVAMKYLSKGDQGILMKEAVNDFWVEET